MRATAGSSSNPAAELAVLRGLATGLSRREIGARLYISLNTVKTHTGELYRKLGVKPRADAVARAEVLGLLDLSNHPGDPPPEPRNSRPRSGMLALDVTASLPCRRRRRTGTTLHLRLRRRDGLCMHRHD